MGLGNLKISFTMLTGVLFAATPSLAAEAVPGHLTISQGTTEMQPGGVIVAHLQQCTSVNVSISTELSDSVLLITAGSGKMQKDAQGNLHFDNTIRCGDGSSAPVFANVNGDLNKSQALVTFESRVERDLIAQAMRNGASLEILDHECPVGSSSCHIDNPLVRIRSSNGTTMTVGNYSTENVLITLPKNPTSDTLDGYISRQGSQQAQAFINGFSGVIPPAQAEVNNIRIISTAGFSSQTGKNTPPAAGIAKNAAPVLFNAQSATH